MICGAICSDDEELIFCDVELEQDGTHEGPHQATLEPDQSVEVEIDGEVQLQEMCTMTCWWDVPPRNLFGGK